MDFRPLTQMKYTWKGRKLQDGLSSAEMNSTHHIAVPTRPPKKVAMILETKLYAVSPRKREIVK